MKKRIIAGALIAAAVVFVLVSASVMRALNAIGGVLGPLSDGDANVVAAEQAARVRYRDAFFDDLRVLGSVPALALQRGSDASEVLNASLPWRIGDSETTPGRSVTLPPSVRAHINGEGWLTLVDDAAVDAVDTTVFSGLARYAVWEQWRNLPDGVPPPKNAIAAPIPDLLAARTLARVHLLRGLRASLAAPAAATAFPAAARDIEAFARLAGTTHLLGGVHAVVLLRDVEEAHAVAVDHGVAGDHVVAVDAATRERLKRALVAASAWFEADAPRADADVVMATPSIVRCAAINEALARATLTRPFGGVDDDRLAAGRESARGVCASTPAFDDVDGAFCSSVQPLEDDVCRRELFLLRLPGVERRVRSWIGGMLSVAQRFRLYDNPAATPAEPTTRPTLRSVTPLPMPPSDAPRDP